MILEFIKWILKNISHSAIRTLLRIFFLVFNLLFYITLLIMVLTWPAIQYPINITSILGIWKTNFLITPTDTELMGVQRRTRGGNGSLCLSFFPKDNLIIAHYIISTWWLHLLDGL